MATITFPNPDVPIAKCPHCGAEVKMNPVWYQKLLELLRLVNSGL
jgi:hypothetical protein